MWWGTVVTHGYVLALSNRGAFFRIEIITSMLLFFNLFWWQVVQTQQPSDGDKHDA